MNVTVKRSSKGGGGGGGGGYNKKIVHSLDQGGGMDDLSVVRHSKKQQSSGSGQRQPYEDNFLGGRREEEEEEEEEDDDFLFGDLQNKSKTLPEDEFMLDEDEEVNYGEDNHVNDYGRGSSSSWFDKEDGDDDEDDNFKRLDSDEDDDDYNNGYNNGNGGGFPIPDDDEEDEKNGGRPKAPSERQRTYQEIQMDKSNYLHKIDRLKRDGWIPRRSCTMQTSLEDLKFEYECLFRERTRDKAIREWGEDTVLWAAGTEKVNAWASKPIHLDDWSKQVYRDVQAGDYNPIYDQLHDKWGGSSMLPPEVQLAKALGMSAIRFHFSHSVKKDAPNIHEVLENNPHLRDAVYAEMQKRAVNNWANKGPPSNGPGPVSMGPQGGAGGNANNPLANGPQPPVVSSTRGAAMKGPSQDTKNLLDGINDDGIDFEAAILPDDDDDDNDDDQFQVNNRSGKKKTTAGIATVDL